MLFFRAKLFGGCGVGRVGGVLVEAVAVGERCSIAQELMQLAL
jgi:hypothetical protein